MFKLAIAKRIGSSPSQIDIIDVRDNVLRLTGSRYRLILQTSSINFECHQLPDPNTD